MNKKKLIATLSGVALVGTAAVGSVAQFCGTSGASGQNLTQQQLAEAIMMALTDYQYIADDGTTVNRIVNVDVNNFISNFLFSAYQLTGPMDTPALEKGINFNLINMSYSGTATVNTSGNTISFTNITSFQVVFETVVTGSDTTSTYRVTNNNAQSTISTITYGTPTNGNNTVLFDSSYTLTGFTVALVTTQQI